MKRQILAPLLLGATIIPAAAQDATWLLNPGSGDFNTAANWTPATVPTGTAFFDTSNTTALLFSANTTLGGWTFNAGASNYSFSNSRVLTFNGAGIVINGGSATVTNNNALRFVNAATAGSTAITNNSTLSFFNTSTAGTATINNIFAFVFFSDTSTAGNAVITNAGSITFGDSSTAGTATITTVAGGFLLSFTDTATAGSATITTDNGSKTQFTTNSNPANAQLITNAGGIADVSNTAGANNDNQITAGSIAGAGVYYLGANQFTVGGNNQSTTVSGVISDCGATGLDCNNAGAVGGSLVKAGTGTLTLSGTNTYTGATTVNVGTLLVNGSIAASSGVTVNTGGILGGTGILPTTIINAGGTLSPGNSIGTITVNGNLTFNAGSNYIVEVSPAAADRTNVTGTATLAGTLTAVFGPGAYTPVSYTVLSAGTRSGTFGAFNTVGLPAFLTANLNYSANEVLLTLTSGLAQIIGNTPNQQAVAVALDTAFNTGHGAFPGFAALAPGQIPAALDALSGEIHANILTTLADDSSFVRSAVLGRLRQATYLNDGTAMASLALGGPLVASADQTDVTALAFAPRALDAYAADFPVKAPPRATNPGWTFWAHAFGAWGRFDSDGNAAETKRSLGGFVSGVDRRLFGDWRAGIAAGYTSSRVNVDARASSATIDTAHLAGYLGKSWGAFNLRSGAAAAWHDISVNRTAAFPGFFDSLRTTYHGNTVQAFSEIGYGMSFGRIAVEPFANLAYVRVEAGGFSEVGGAAALTAGSTHYQVGYTGLGVRAATTMTVANSIVAPHLTLAWQHALSSVTPTKTLAFIGTGAGFTISGVPLARNAALVDAGLDVAIARNTTVGLSYVGQLSSAVQDHAVKGRAAIRF